MLFARDGRGLTQVDFAEAVGVTARAVRFWESDAKVPDLDRLRDIARVLRVALAWLLEGPVPVVHYVLPGCTGAASCQAFVHMHGCFGDDGNCTAPDEHRGGAGAAGGTDAGELLPHASRPNGATRRRAA